MTREEAINRFKGIRDSFSISIAQSKFYPSKVILNELCDKAIEALSAETATLNHEKVRITDTDSVEKVQSEQVTSKLKNPCDSLLTDDKDDSKEQKSKLDLISRAEVNNEICEVIMQEFDVPPTRAYEVSEKILKLLPSADRPNAYADVVNKADNKVYSKISDGEPFGYHSADRPTLKQTDTLIIADALRYLAEDEERHGKDRAKAEKLREQILAYGASMCPSADRPMGEWQKAYRKTANGVDFRVIECNKCGFADAQMNYYHYCPNCGARMGNDDDDLDGLKIIAIIDGEGGSE